MKPISVFASLVALFLPSALAIPAIRRSNSTSTTTPYPLTNGTLTTPNPSLSSSTPQTPACTSGQEKCKYDAVHGWGVMDCAAGRWHVYAWCGALETCESIDETTGCVSGAKPEGDGDKEKEEGKQCRASEYRCNDDGNGWDACDGQGQWVSAGTCAPAQVCVMNKESGSPYCENIVEHIRHEGGIRP